MVNWTDLDEFPIGPVGQTSPHFLPLIFPRESTSRRHPNGLRPEWRGS